MLRFSALFVGFLVLAPVCATAQVALKDIVTIEVLDGGATARGTHQAALQLTLAEGWKTYWRAPGDSGIPPRFDWTGSRNLAQARIVWPRPRVYDEHGLRTIGYSDEVVLPIELSPKHEGAAMRLSGRMELGVCREVCVPAELRFSARLDTQAGRHPSIAAALADRPFSATEAGVTSAVCKVAPTDRGLRVTAHIALPPTGGTEYAVVEPGDARIWVSEAETTRQGDTLTVVSELQRDGAIALDRSALRITVLGRKMAVDIQGCSAG